MTKNSDDSLGFVAGTIIGVLAGVTAGLIFSPRSGREIRSELIDKVSAESLNKVKFGIENQLNKINDAVKAGRMAAAKRKEEIEAGY